jgi:hypothetical protein
LSSGSWWRTPAADGGVVQRAGRGVAELFGVDVSKPYGAVVDVHLDCISSIDAPWAGPSPSSVISSFVVTAGVTNRTANVNAHKPEPDPDRCRWGLSTDLAQS